MAHFEDGCQQQRNARKKGQEMRRSTESRQINFRKGCAAFFESELQDWRGGIGCNYFVCMLFMPKN